MRAWFIMSSPAGSKSSTLGCRRSFRVLAIKSSRCKKARVSVIGINLAFRFFVAAKCILRSDRIRSDIFLSDPTGPDPIRSYPTWSDLVWFYIYSDSIRRGPRLFGVRFSFLRNSSVHSFWCEAWSARGESWLLILKKISKRSSEMEKSGSKHACPMKRKFPFWTKMVFWLDPV